MIYTGAAGKTYFSSQLEYTKDSFITQDKNEHFEGG